MGKQRNAIINVGTAGSIIGKATPDKYSIELHGYTADEVRDIFETVHSMVRPTEDAATEPIPFTLGGFTLVSKFGTDDEPNPFESDGEMPSAVTTHDGEEGELDRCACETDTPPEGTLCVCINSVNHRFLNFPDARRFALRFNLVPESVFADPVEDAQLCCFPYTFHRPNGSPMGFQTEVFAQYMANVHGLEASDVTYHADEHVPEHRARFEARMASNEPNEKYTDPDAEPDEQPDGIAFTVTTDPATVPVEPWLPAVDADGESTAFRMRDGVKVPEQRDAAPDLIQQYGYPSHPNPCLPGCSCGNGPAPLAAEPTDG